MADATDKRNAAQNRAQKHFTATERRDATFRETIEHDRSAREAKNAKLRALRFEKEAKEAVERAEAARVAAENPPPKKRTRTRAKAKPLAN